MSAVNADHTVTATTNFGSPGYDWMKLPANHGTVANVRTQRAWRSFRPHLRRRGGRHGRQRRVCAGPGRPEDLRAGELQAKKTWFCFGDTVVCLGSGIRDSHAACETDTTLFQNPLWHPEREQTYLGDTHGITAVPFEKDLSTATWLVDTLGTGYCTFDGQPLCVRRQAQMP